MLVQGESVLFLPWGILEFELRDLELEKEQEKEKRWASKEETDELIRCYDFKILTPASFEIQNSLSFEVENENLLSLNSTKDKTQLPKEPETNNLNNPRTKNKIKRPHASFSSFFSLTKPLQRSVWKRKCEQKKENHRSSDQQQKDGLYTHFPNRNNDLILQTKTSYPSSYLISSPAIQNSDSKVNLNQKQNKSKTESQKNKNKAEKRRTSPTSNLKDFLKLDEVSKAKTIQKWEFLQNRENDRPSSLQEDSNVVSLSLVKATALARNFKRTKLTPRHLNSAVSACNLFAQIQNWKKGQQNRKARKQQQPSQHRQNLMKKLQK